jgi:hypothetical protein
MVTTAKRGGRVEPFRLGLQPHAPDATGRPDRGGSFIAWLRAQQDRRDAVGALSRAVADAEAHRGGRFHWLAPLLSHLCMHGGPAANATLDVALAEWKLAMLRKAAAKAPGRLPSG